MDEWKSTAVPKNGLWTDPTNWAKQRPINTNPPDCNVWACVVANPPGPAILANAQCSRLSMYPWSWAWGGTANMTDCNVRGGLFDAGLCVDVAGKGAFSAAVPGQEWGPANFFVYAGTIITPDAQTWGGEGDINGLWVGGSQSMVSYLTAGRAFISGGLVSVPRIAIYNGEIHLTGGVLEGLHGPRVLPDPCHPGLDGNDFWIGENLPGSAYKNILNIAGGTLLLKGDWTNVIAEYNAAGKIISYNRRGSPVWDYDITNAGKTTVIGAATFGLAWNPVPR